MQNVHSLVDAESELEESAAGVDATRPASGPLSRFAFQWWASVGSGSMAGFVFALADICRASTAAHAWIGWTSSMAVLGLWLWFGESLGCVVWLARMSAVALKRRMPNRVAWHGLLVLMAGGLALLLARKVFAGGGIRQTYVGRLGPWVVPLGVALSASIAPWIAGRFVVDGSSKKLRWSIIAVAALLSAAALVLDALGPGGMLYFHVLLLSLGLALAFQALELIRLHPLARYAALALSLFTVPSLLTFPSSRGARELLVQPTWAGLELVEYLQFHVDFDHDGYSPLFGGGDCDDGNASVFTGATERAGDGQDSNCDGMDDAPPSALSFAPFQVSEDGPSRRIAEQAKQFPTVVVLVDALRFDRLENPRFLNLAQLVRESIRFTHAYATSATTLASVPAMMSGRVRPAKGRDDVARSLARVGQSSHFVAPDVVIEHFSKLGPRNPLLGFSAREAITTDHGTGWGAGDTVPTSDRITAAALQQLDSAQPPALLWLHYFDVHQWNVLEEEGLPAFRDITRYDAVLERLDQSLGPLLERRDRVNLVLLADHGEGLGERGVTYHANFLFHQLAHIPLLVRVPGTEPARVDIPVTTPGVYNMLLALRGIPPDVTADRNLLDLLGATGVGNGPGFPSFDNSQWSLVYGTHRLLYTPRQQLLELYDVEADPSEAKNQADANPKLASELLARLFQLQKESSQ